MVKQTLKSRLFLKKSFLKSLKSKPKERLLVPSTGLQPTGLIASLSRSNMKKSIQKKMTIQNSWLWTQPFLSPVSLHWLALWLPSSLQIRLLAMGWLPSCWLGLLEGWPSTWCTTLSTSIMDQTQIVASALLSGSQSSLSWLLWSFGWLSSLQQASYQPTSIQSLLHCLWLSWELPFSLFASISRNVSISEAQARAHHVIKKSEKLWHIVNL